MLPTMLTTSNSSAARSPRRRVVALLASVLGLAIPFTASYAATQGEAFPNAESVQPLKEGAMTPSAMVLTVTGEAVDLSEVVKSTGALLVFYRGGW
ncbi:MAG: hypothetical protein ACI9QQ_002107 [Myxococcota bacterium]|jgi:hypothetical protein